MATVLYVGEQMFTIRIVRFSRKNITDELFYQRVGSCTLEVDGQGLFYDIYIDGFTGNQFLVPIGPGDMYMLPDIILPTEGWRTYEIKPEVQYGQESIKNKAS